MKGISEFYPLLDNPVKVVITMHQKPDGDAMGSALGLYLFLKKLGHSVTVVSPTNWAGFLNWLPECNSVVDFEKNKAKGADIVKEAELIFCLDFNVLHRTKNMEHVLSEAKCTKVLIDHHEQPQTQAFDYGISNTHKSSTSEMVYDLIIESGHSQHLDLNIAACLYTGIMMDTGSFRFTCTTASVHHAVAHFKELGLNHSPIHERIYDEFLENRLRFLGNALLNRMEVFFEYNTVLMAIPALDIMEYDIQTGDTEGIVNFLLSIKGIKFGAMVIDRGEECRWSFRSKGNFDVNIFARKNFNGGGHANASGGSSNASLAENIALFKNVLKNYEAELSEEYTPEIFF
ncbi:MAG: DHH family phosphoesterase [Chitinophagaceae bacterium]|jgi:phosphoesterase RecJ-like protein|nr:DHH family phosphoesterase [Chitinophagaceae bacterium]